MLKAPKRTDEIVTIDKRGKAVPTRRMSVFMESSPDGMTAIDDLTGTPTNTELKDKINELLAAMRTANLLNTE